MREKLPKKTEKHREGKCRPIPILYKTYFITKTFCHCWLPSLCPFVSKKNEVLFGCRQSEACRSEKSILIVHSQAEAVSSRHPLAALPAELLARSRQQHLAAPVPAENVPAENVSRAPGGIFRHPSRQRSLAAHQHQLQSALRRPPWARPSWCRSPCLRAAARCATRRHHAGTGCAARATASPPVQP
jgi:hypothetical protein